MEEGRCDYRGQQEGDLGGDGVVLILMAVWFQNSPYVIKWHRTIYTDWTNVSFLILILYYSYDAVTIGGN